MTLTPEIKEIIDIAVNRAVREISSEQKAFKYKKVLTKKEAAKALSCGLTKIETLIKDGLLEIVKIGGGIYITVRSLEILQIPN